MIYFSLAKKLVLNKPLLHLIIIIQITCSFFVINSAVSTFNLTTGSSNFMGDLLESDFIYFSVAERTHNLAETVGNTEYFEKELKGLDVAVCYENVSVIVNNKITDAVVSSSKILHKTNPQMRFGDGFTNENEKDGVIRLITNDNSFKSGKEYDGVICDYQGNQTNVKFLVTGIYNNPAYFMDVSSAGSAMSSANICDLMEKPSAAGDYFQSIICLEDYERVIGEKRMHPVNKTAMLLFKDNITEKEKEYNISFLNQRGVVATAEDIKAETDTTNDFVLKQNLPMFVFLITVSLFSLFAVSVINITQQMKTLTLYSILGCSEKDISRVIRCYIGIISLIPLWVIYIILSLSSYINFLQSYFLCVGVANYLLPLLLAFLIISVVPIFPVNTFKNNTLNELRR